MPWQRLGRRGGQAQVGAVAVRLPQAPGTPSLDVEEGRVGDEDRGRPDVVDKQLRIRM
ncbi:hypothetical protein [Streptomyces sp. NPDC018038]|uniref:hypothetical protein n=1 Tax=Streptomyces sp. NPDC018038 TaxID=3365036 RepID=UPI0037A38ABC